MTRKIYQTLEDRNNPDVVENQGPFLCNRKDVWLGIGYYFWDSFIENAHWWGKEGARYKNYFICESSFELNEIGFVLSFLRVGGRIGTHPFRQTGRKNTGGSKM